MLDQLPPGSDVIVGLGNGEPVTVIDAIEDGAEHLREVTLHQMLPLRDRRYIDGEIPNLHHVSWFLSPHDREAFHNGKCDLVPNTFSEVPALMKAVDEADGRARGGEPRPTATATSRSARTPSTWRR